MQGLAMRLSERLAYGLLALPLALIGLPLYVYLPTLFAQNTGLGLAAIGTVLLTARLVEACVDPLLGNYVAKLHQAGQVQRLSRLSQMIAVLMCLAVIVTLASPYWLGFFGANWLRAVMLCGLVLVAYIAYGWLSIVHYTLGTHWVAQTGATTEAATRLYGVREALALAGVLLGSVLPLVVSWLVYGLVCAAMVALGLLTLAPSWRALAQGRTNTDANSQAKADAAVQITNSNFPLDPFIKRVLLVFFISTLAGSLPASLLGFYVADVLGLGNSAPQYLAIYFSTGALGFALWPRLAARYSAVRLWAVAMLCAALAFCFALFLRADTPHVALWFGVVCGATGFLLGAEWMLPQSVVATRLARLDQTRQAGRVFGLWTWAQKMALAIATGVALWGLAALGYAPGDSSSNTGALVMLYCLLPAIMKAAAAAAAWHLLKDKK